MALADEHCRELPKGTPPLPQNEAQRLATQVPSWRLEGNALVRDFRERDFRHALATANRIGEVAEAQSHHPDLHITAYRNLRVETSTHSVGGLSRNDFILAARIDRLLEAAPPGDAGAPAPRQGMHG